MIHELMRVLPPALLALPLVCTQGAEDQLEELLARHTRTLFGYSVARAADLDGDGFDDIAVGACGRDAKSASSAGAVVVLSSKDGQLLRTHLGTEPDEWLGLGLADVGDLDGDGARDLAVGGKVSLRALSGRTGEVLWSDDRHNACLGRLGDMDGDGRDDLLLQAGWPMEARERHVAGAGGLRLGPLDLPGDGSLALVGDLDGDGLSELLHNEGRCWRILDLRKAEPVLERELDLRRWEGALHVYERDGEPVAALGLPRGATSRTQHAMGRLVVLSLRTLDVVLDVRDVPPGSEHDGNFGESVLGLPDRDDDGVDELLVAVPDSFPGGALALHSGRTGERLWMYEGGFDEWGLGRSMAWLPGEGGGRIALGCAGWFNQGIPMEALHVLSVPELEERFAVRHRALPPQTR